MRKKKRQPLPRNVAEFASAIIKELEIVTTTSGWRSGEVFNDWLELIYYTLRAQPDHVRAITAGLPLRESPPDEAAAFARARNRYGKHWELAHTQFSYALGWAQLAAQSGVTDVIGPIFEQWAWPSPDAGQFFTPPDVAKVLVQIIGGENSRAVGTTGASGSTSVGLDNTAAALGAALETAIARTPLAALMAFFGQAFRMNVGNRPRLVEAGAMVLELDPLFAAHLHTACADGVDAFMALLLGESYRMRPEEGDRSSDDRPLDHLIAGLLPTTDALGRGLEHLITISTSARVLHLWVWALRTTDPDRCHWLLRAIARIIEGDQALCDRLCAQIAEVPAMRQIEPGSWALDLLSHAERRWMIEQVVTLVLPIFEGIGVYDPAAGAATLLLHTAELLAEHGYAWAVDAALIRFYGQEIDRRVWLMGNINLMVAGLNGHRLRVIMARVEGQILELQRRRAERLERFVAAPEPDDIATNDLAHQFCLIDATIQALQKGDSPDQQLWVSHAAHARMAQELRTAWAQAREAGANRERAELALIAA